MSDAEIRALERALAADPWDVDAHEALAEALEALGRLEQAAAHLDHAQLLVAHLAGEERDHIWHLENLGRRHGGDWVPHNRMPARRRRAISEAHSILASLQDRGTELQRRSSGVKDRLGGRWEDWRQGGVGGEAPDSLSSLAELLDLVGAVLGERAVRRDERTGRELSAKRSQLGSFLGATTLVEADYWTREEGDVLHGIYLTMAFGDVRRDALVSHHAIVGSRGHAYLNARVQFTESGLRPHVHSFSTFRYDARGVDVKPLGSMGSTESPFVGPLHMLTLARLSESYVARAERPRR